MGELQPSRAGKSELRRQVLLGVSVALVVAACGLAPAATNALGAAGSSGSATLNVGSGSGSSLAGSSASPTLPGSGLGGPSTPGVADSGLAGPANVAQGAGSAGPSVASGGSAGSGGGDTSGPVAGPSVSGSLPSYERVGITDTTIYIGMHAPITGAAPIPLTAIETGAKLFWENHTLFGHKVVMDVMDDQYNPSTARQVCETMSRRDFLIMGSAGTDQIQACATDPVLARTHTPYMSTGVTTNGLLDLPDYFASTQTYGAQSPEVWQMAAQLYPSDAHQRWAVVTENTPNFSDAQASMDAVLNREHISYCNITPPKYYSQQDAATAVNQARACGAKVVYLDVDPNFWIDMAGAAGVTYTPDWVGPGVTNGENLVAPAVCGEQAGIKAAYLSPFPGIDHEPPGFAAENNPPPDAPAAERDLELGEYGGAEALWSGLQRLGSIDNLTRDNIIAQTPTSGETYGQQLTVFPTIHFGGTHFGGTGAWELQLSCTQQEYKTAGLLYG